MENRDTAVVDYLDHGFDHGYTDDTITLPAIKDLPSEYARTWNSPTIRLPVITDLPAPNALVPTVVVDDVHVVYRINTGAVWDASPIAGFKRMMTRTKSAAMREVHAVKGVSFVTYEGEAIGLIGSNGSGKSTLLRAIAGLLPTASGKVFTKGQPSLLGVNAALLNDLPGERNVILGCLAMGMSLAEAKTKVAEVIEFSGINERGDFASLPMRTYSSGMAARLRFAIAAARSHDVLLIDEALATGDATFRKRSEDRVRELREEAGTVFLVSHQLSTIRSTCERTLWLEAGELRMDGPTKDVIAEYKKFTKSE
jgi:teichoic acid transport system ATP-binding protein